MCTLCDAGLLQDHSGFAAQFPEGAAATGVAASGLNLLAPRAASADDDDKEPEDSGGPGRRYLIRGGAVMSMDPKVGDFPQADVLVEGKKIVAVGPNLHAGGAARDRRARPHRHAGLHRHAPSPVRDRAAQLPRRRRADQRRLGLAERQHHLLRVHPAEVRAGLPAAGRVHQRAVRRAEPARRRRHHGARRLADPSLAAALGCRHPGAVRYRAPRRLRLFRERGRQHPRHQSRQQVSDRRAPHQEAVVLVERPARPHDHGRRGLSRRCRRPSSPGRSGVSSACRSRRTSSRRSASVRSSTSSRTGTGGNGTHRDRTGQPVHPHDRDVRRRPGRGSRTSARRSRSPSRSR